MKIQIITKCTCGKIIKERFEEINTTELESLVINNPIVFHDICKTCRKKRTKRSIKV